MNRNQLARALAAAGATLAGLALFCLCLRTVSAAAPGAGDGRLPAAAQIWHVAAAPGDGLVGYWKFDQISGTTTFNSALLSDTTRLENGAALTTGVPTSLTIPNFEALQLDGVNDDAKVNDAAALDVPPTSFAVAAWVRRVLTGTSTSDLIYDSGTQSGHWFLGFLGANAGAANQDRLTLTINGVKDYTSTLKVTDSRWHHVAAVVNGSGTNNLVMYLDGSPSAAISAVITTTPSGPKLIGNKNGSLNTPFSGDIDELRLYNRALSAAEVQRLAAGSGCVTDGLTWPTAFGDLQCALAIAQDGDQIWIARGAYRPGTDQEASFRLFKDLSLLGGFNGSESSPAQRPAFNPNAPLTVLSGDAAGDDGPGFANDGENVCNVVSTGSLLPSIVAISDAFDGLAIAGGNAHCHHLESTSTGGGLDDFSASQLSFNNVVFQSNEADLGGGGLAASGASLTLSATTFLSNTALDGGGLSDFGPLTMTNSLFISNTAIQQGGGAIFSGTFNGTNLTFTHNLVTPAVGFGGGLYQVGGSADLTNAAFISNTASQLGGGLYTEEGALTLTNPSFISNTALQDGGGLFNRVAAVINGGTFSDNRATLAGGGLADKQAGSLAVTGATFARNHAHNGGGLFTNFPLSLVNNQFQNNTAEEEGGALVVEADGEFAVTITGGSFSGNQASEGGALVAVEQISFLDLSVSQVTFSHNQTSAAGGAIETDSIAPGIIRSHFSHLTFTNNASQNSDGGAIFDDGGLVSVADSQFTGNSAPSGAGGGLAAGRAEAGSAVTVTNSTFSGNDAQDTGGGLSVIGSLVMSGSSVIQNRAQDLNLVSDFTSVGGGALVSGTALITNSQFISNSAVITGAENTNLAGGGGLAISGTLTLTGSDFRGNSAEHGGGLQVEGSAAIQSSRFQGNQAGSGGGVFADGGLELLNNRLIDNTALELLANEGSAGGGLLLQNGLNPVLIVNNLFLGNQALSSDSSTPHGSAMALGGVATTVANNTIVARGLDSTSAASQITGSVSFANNIITSHTVAIEQLGGVFLFEDYNLFHGNTTNISATGTIVSPGHSRVADPRFVSSVLDDYRLRLDSPAIDAGDNNLVPNISTTDLSGGPRFADVHAVPDTGAGTAPIVDIGAFENSDDLFLPLMSR